MGLTGIVLRAAFRLRAIETGWIRQQTHVAANIDDAIDRFDTTLDSTYSVAWIVVQTGQPRRSLITLGEHATTGDLGEHKLTFPTTPPAGNRRR